MFRRSAQFIVSAFLKLLRESALYSAIIGCAACGRTVLSAVLSGLLLIYLTEDGVSGLREALHSCLDIGGIVVHGGFFCFFYVST